MRTEASDFMASKVSSSARLTGGRMTPPDVDSAARSSARERALATTRDSAVVRDSLKRSWEAEICRRLWVMST